MTRHEQERKGRGNCVTSNPSGPLPVLLAIGGGFAVFSSPSARRPPQALQPRQAGLLRVRHRAHASRPRRRPFPVKYYLTAMMFIIFDIESVFLFPFAVAFNRLALFALVEAVLIIPTVFIAYAYVWRRGGLDWDLRSRWVSRRSCQPASC